MSDDDHECTFSATGRTYTTPLGHEKKEYKCTHSNCDESYWE